MHPLRPRVDVDPPHLDRAVSTGTAIEEPEGPDEAGSDLVARLRDRLGRGGPPVALAIAPYRICPVGAHVDHQGGEVLGMTIDARTLLAFAPHPTIEIESDNYPGRVVIDPQTPGAAVDGEWGRYAVAALLALRERLPARPRGFIGRLRGSLPGGGLSSSASVLLAYLSALARVNDLVIEPRELVDRTVRAENEFVGVQSGILDPASIVGGRREHLLSIDSRARRWEPIPLPPGAPDHRFVVAFTGTERNLARTDFNQRVRECREAADLLGRRIGRPEPTLRLGDLPEAVLFDASSVLPAALARRALHYVGEKRRVERARAAWRAGDLVDFGAQMSASCESSIRLFETGSPELVELQTIWEETPGVLGARFSGAGFGGCSLALVEGARAEEICGSVLDAFRRRVPDLADRARLFVTRSDDGLRVVA